MDYINPLFLTDGYKLDHRRQYPEGTEYVMANWTPRGSRIEGVNEVIFFGLQATLIRMQDAFDKFFKGDVDEFCAEYERRNLNYVGPNGIGSQHWRDLHALGYLPLEFRALPEGTKVPVRVPMFTVINTHPDFFWLVNYLETFISANMWLPSTSATIAYRMRKMLNNRALLSGMTEADADFQGHDFSMRGMAGVEAASISGAGHALSFIGGDNLPAVDFIKTFYGDEPTYMGVPATEHSVMCAGGQESERDTYDRLLDLYPSGIVSIVSDTWDFWNVVTNILPSLKDKIMAREGTLVIRPDSGDPADILCGTVRDFGKGTTPEEKGLIELLWDEFGGTTNERGFKQLDSHIGAIYGDSINFERADDITARLMEKGFVSTQVVLGMGSFGYQYNTRDTFGFAIKSTWVQINGEGKAIFKDPKTDNGTKKSAKGLLTVVEGADGTLVLKDNLSPAEADSGLLETVWKNGKFVRKTSFAEARKVLWG